MIKGRERKSAAAKGRPSSRKFLLSGVLASSLTHHEAAIKSAMMPWKIFIVVQSRVVVKQRSVQGCRGRDNES